MTTYSVGLYGTLAGSSFVPAKQIEVPDADENTTPNSVAVTAAAFGGAMARGQQMLCKFPDGSQRWCLIDERSTFANPILRPVSP